MRHRSTSTSPDATARIEGILQYGQFTGTSIPVYHGPVNPLKVIVAWGAFALFHSLTVSERYERLARRVLGEKRFGAYHRLLFTAVSAAATAAVLLYVRSLPDAPLYRIEGIPRLLLHAAQAAGAAFLLWTPWDLREFVGIRQWKRARRGEPPGGGGNERLFTGKAYAVVRHPLYLGCSVLLAFHPVQSRNSLLSAAMIALYFYAGTFFEERRMLRKFGEAYREYQRRVPRFLPLPRP
ncbi:MAG TPA: isoprenylcysteine carboxylmethyltransferase family protein [Candidatus Methylomirabilis sp.]|nr:isoprenylcysteine carboxylmethyltransferase family protein [Candidatus Methylomirabilis sp.]